MSLWISVAVCSTLVLHYCGLASSITLHRILLVSSSSFVVTVDVILQRMISRGVKFVYANDSGFHRSARGKQGFISTGEKAVIPSLLMLHEVSELVFVFNILLCVYRFGSRNQNYQSSRSRKKSVFNFKLNFVIDYLVPFVIVQWCCIWKTKLWKIFNYAADDGSSVSSFMKMICR